MQKPYILTSILIALCCSWPLDSGWGYWDVKVPNSTDIQKHMDPILGGNIRTDAHWEQVYPGESPNPSPNLKIDWNVRCKRVDNKKSVNLNSTSAKTTQMTANNHEGTLVLAGEYSIDSEKTNC